MEPATKLLEELMDEKLLTQRLLDRRPSESAMNMAERIIWNDRHIPEIQNLDYANELTAAMAVQMGRMKSVFSTAWDIKMKEKDDLRREIEKLEKTLAQFQECNDSAQKLGSAIQSNLHSYIDQVLPHLKTGCGVYDVLQTYAEKVRNFCMTSLETTQRMRSGDPPMQYGPAGELKHRFGLVGGNLHEVVDILEKFKENSQVGRFPKLVKVGEDVEENPFRMELGSSDEEELLSSPTNQRSDMSVGESTSEIPHDYTWDENKSVREERNAGKGTSPVVESKVAHAAESTLEVSGGRKSGVQKRRRRGREPCNELVAEEPAAKVRPVKKHPRAARQGLRERSSSLSYKEDKEDDVQEIKCRTSVRRGSVRGRGFHGGKTQEKKPKETAGSSSKGNGSRRGGRSKTSGGSNTVIDVIDVVGEADVGKDVLEKPCCSTSLNVSAQSSTSSLEAFQKPRVGKHGEKKSYNWGPRETWSDAQKWAVDVAWDEGETFCRVCKRKPVKDYNGFVKHMAQVHYCGKRSDLLKHVNAKTEELNKRIERRREKDNKLLEEAAKLAEEEERKTQLDSNPKESDVIGKDREKTDG